jgi:hypothetical protein
VLRGASDNHAKPAAEPAWRGAGLNILRPGVPRSDHSVPLIRMASRWAKTGATVLFSGGAAWAACSISLALSDEHTPRWIHDRLPSRAEQLRRLSQGSAATPYDVLIIGGKGDAEDRLQQHGIGGRPADSRRAVARCPLCSLCSVQAAQREQGVPWMLSQGGRQDGVGSALALVDCLASLCVAYSSAPNQSPCCPPGRGLRTAMVEREDFAAGTSSRSTKLVHGGVRYLEKVSLPLVSRCLAVGSG